MGRIGAVGLVLHPKRDCALAVELVTRWAAAREVAVFGVAGELDGVMGVQLLEQYRIAEHVDLLVSLGGDGTMLRTLRLAYRHQVPVLGVNLGKFGFLAEIEVPDLDDALCSIAAERFEVEPRVAIEALVGGTVRVQLLRWRADRLAQSGGTARRARRPAFRLQPRPHVGL